MPTNADALLDDLVELIAPKLVKRGFVRSQDAAMKAPVSDDYDETTCRQLIDREHLSDSVLERARIFFAKLGEQGSLSSLDVVELLDLKGPTSVPANLTNPLKKSARRLGIEEPWSWGENEDGTRTIWSDRDGIAARMTKAIEAELAIRGLAKA
jgi:hypothetical protein